MAVVLEVVGWSPNTVLQIPGCAGQTRHATSHLSHSKPQPLLLMTPMAFRRPLGGCPILTSTASRSLSPR